MVTIPVHYGFLFLASLDDEQPELLQTRQGQQNGLCGAAVPGALSLVTGLHTGEVPVSVEWHDRTASPIGLLSASVSPRPARGHVRFRTPRVSS